MTNTTVRIAAISDVHVSKTSAGALQPLFTEIAEQADVLVICGDLTDYGLPEEARILARELAPARIPTLAVLGNHDVKQGHAAGQVAALGMDGRWWARHVGEVLIIGLDSNEVDDPDQLAWLERTLASSTDRWRIVMLHHPPYSAGYQGSRGDVRRAFAPLFERYGVQLVLSGHDHDYQRSKPINGVTYVVSGGAAGTRRTGEDDFTAVSFSWHNFVELAVFHDRLVIRAVNQDVRVADEAVLQP
jgi:3',5'-cyclic AMP phosphodiesterase CpdA